MTTLVSTRIRELTFAKKVALTLLATFLISMSAPLKIPLFFSPVPITLQAHVILMLAVIVGPRMTSMAVGLTLIQAAMGLPVMSGTTGVFGPTAGYIAGYLVAAYVTGKTAPRFGSLRAMALGNGIIYTLGVSVLSLWIGWKGALIGGLLPFIPGDLLKLALGYCALRRWQPRQHFPSL